MPVDLNLKKIYKNRIKLPYFKNIKLKDYVRTIKRTITGVVGKIELNVRLLIKFEWPELN